jgi:hypothetical protein
MENFTFENFELICLKSSVEELDAVLGVNDIFISKSKEGFIEQLRGVSTKRLEYINYWKTHVLKSHIAMYDELIQRRIEIEKKVNGLDADCFIIRKEN